MSFRYEGRVSLTNVNVRKEKHGEERVLAMDLTIEAPAVSADTVAELLGIPAPGFRKTWWDSKGQPNLPNVKPLGLTTAFKGKDGADSDHRIRLEDATIVEDRAAIIDKFVATPIEGHQCELKFRIAISEPKQEMVALAAAVLQDTVKLFVTPDPQLDLGEPEVDEEKPTVEEDGTDEGAVDGKSGSADDIPDKVREAWDQEDRELAAQGAED